MGGLKWLAGTLLSLLVWHMSFPEHISHIRRRFPRYLLNPAVRYPLIVRLGILAEYLISKQNREVHAKSGRASYRLLSMTGTAHLLLLRESLYSFLCASSSLPPLEILNDGSLQDDEIRRALSFWPEPFQIFHPDQIMLSIHEYPFYPFLDTLAASHPLGLKLAFILCRSQYGNQLFSDSDILWFRDPAHYLDGQLLTCPIAIGREDSVSLNQNLAKLFFPKLLQLPGPNSGCVWSTTNLLDVDCLHQVLSASVDYPTDYFNEQTILAILTCMRGEWLPDHVCETSFHDRFALIRANPQSSPHCSRHYVNILRHLFYLDAISMSGGWIKAISNYLFSRLQFD